MGRLQESQIDKFVCLLCLACIKEYSLGCHHVIRQNDEREIVDLSTPRPLDNEGLGFVKDGWTVFEIKITLFDEAEFDEEIRRISRPRERVPCRWKEPDPRELMRVEGLSSNDVYLLLRWSLSAEGSGEDDGIPYTSVLNKYKYYATYEVSSAKHHLFCVVIFSFSFTV